MTGTEVHPSFGERPGDRPSVTLTRTVQGWSVTGPSGGSNAADLVEGLTLADLIAEECGTLTEPSRTARRSARGPGLAGQPAEDPVAGRTAALERTVAQLEHALAARVSTERAIGVLAERNRTSPRAAFESLRREARSSGRPVAELAREILRSLEALADVGAPPDAEPGRPLTRGATAPVPRPASRSGAGRAAVNPVVAASVVALADGGS